MDPVGWFIATIHGLLGHEKAMILSGVPPRPDDGTCLLCRYERKPTPENRAAVITALAPQGGT